MLAFFTALLEFLRSLVWPLFIVTKPEEGVKYRFGRPLKVLQPGWYFAWPFFEEIKKTNCAEATLDLTNMPLTTWDEVGLTVSYNIRYRIVDVLKFQTIVQNGAESMHAEAACEVALRLRKRLWSKIYRSQGRIERRITATLTKRFASWGIEVVGGGLTVCTKSKTISLINVE